MCLLLKADYLLEMLMIDVSVHSEQPLQDGFGDCKEIFWKWYP